MRCSSRLVRAFAVLNAFAVLAACRAPGPDAQLRVQEHQRVLGRFTLTHLQRLPQVQVATPQSHGAQVQTGPTVRSILATAGAPGVTRLRVEGRDSAQVLTPTQLDDPVILAITKRNTLKLAGTKFPVDHWVQDITALAVNP